MTSYNFKFIISDFRVLEKIISCEMLRIVAYVRYTVINFFRLEQLNSVFFLDRFLLHQNMQQVSITSNFRTPFSNIGKYARNPFLFPFLLLVIIYWNATQTFQKNTVGVLYDRFFWVLATLSGSQKRRVKNCWRWKEENQQGKMETRREKHQSVKKINKKFTQRGIARNAKRKREWRCKKCEEGSLGCSGHMRIIDRRTSRKLIAWSVIADRNWNKSVSSKFMKSRWSII